MCPDFSPSHLAFARPSAEGRAGAFCVSGEGSFCMVTSPQAGRATIRIALLICGSVFNLAVGWSVKGWSSIGVICATLGERFGKD